VTVLKVVYLVDGYKFRWVGDGMTAKNQNLFSLKLIYVFLSTKQIWENDCHFVIDVKSTGK